MEEKFLLALDGGTGSFRAVAFDLKGNQKAIAQIEWKHLENPQYEGSVDFDYEKNIDIVFSCIKNLLTENEILANQIIGISTTSMREGFVLYDENKTELIAFSNVDARSFKEATFLKEKYPDLEKEIYNETGESFALSAIPRLLWLKENLPDIYEKTTYINMINDWIVFKLTNELSTEPSNASTTGLFSLKTRQWDTKIAKKAGIKDTIFPKVIESGNIVGKVTKEVSNITGLLEGTPVVAGGGDSQLGTIGVGAIYENQAALFGGSFWQYEYNMSKPIVDKNYNSRVNCHAINNIWQNELIVWNGGLSMRWFRDAFCQYEKEIAKKEGIDVYQILDRNIENIPAGCYGMYSMFADEMKFMNLKHCAPTFTNFALDPEKFNKYTFYKSIMENTAIVAYGHIKYTEQMMGKSPEYIIFASGASNNENWCQILSDVTGKIIKTPVIKEATALGAAFLAGLGVGVYKDISEILEFIKWDKAYYPNEENHETYKAIYNNWKELYKLQLDISDKGLTRHMWIAPGIK